MSKDIQIFDMILPKYTNTQKNKRYDKKNLIMTIIKINNTLIKTCGKVYFLLYCLITTFIDLKNIVSDYNEIV